MATMNAKVPFSGADLKLYERHANAAYVERMQIQQWSEADKTAVAVLLQVFATEFNFNGFSVAFTADHKPVPVLRGHFQGSMLLDGYVRTMLERKFGMNADSMNLSMPAAIAQAIDIVQCVRQSLNMDRGLVPTVTVGGRQIYPASNALA